MKKSLVQLSSDIKDGSISSQYIVEDSLKTTNLKNPELNAFSDVYALEALELAKLRDEETAKGISRGPLHGIPVGVKDLFLTKGRRTARGSRQYKTFVPEQNAPIIDRLEAAGAIIFGKTTTTEMGWTGSSVSEYYGATKNPWNSQLTSGGSSSGSGAALASGMVPIAVGSDGGGSVRIPASFCGIFAMKGSLGRIPAYPWSATEMLSHAGPMTLTADDSALMFDILKGPDPRDHLALPAEGFNYQDHELDVRNLRIAYAPTMFGVDVDDDVAKCVETGIDTIRRVFGIEPKLVKLDWEDPIKIFETLWVTGRGVAYGRTGSEDKPKFGSGFSNLVEKSKTFSIENYIDAMKARAVYSNKVHGFFDQFDILLMPTIPILPFNAELEKPDGYKDNSDILPWTGWTPFTYPFNITGNPAASMPIGLSKSGLPVGLQVVGKRYSDANVLAFCKLLEKNIGQLV